MNDRELDGILKRAKAPEWPGEYWEQFPGSVMAQIIRGEQPLRVVEQAQNVISAAAGPLAWAGSLRFPVWASGLAVLGILVAVFLGSWRGQTMGKTEEGKIQKCFREIEALFPHQVQSLVFEDTGAHLVLAEQPDVPVSLPLLITISGPKGPQRIVTFSGQQIRIAGEVCDVLLDGGGAIRSGVSP